MADEIPAIPAAVQALIGVKQYEEDTTFDIEMGYVHNTCAAVQNGNPLFWDEATAENLTHGWIAPPTMMSSNWREAMRSTDTSSASTPACSSPM